MHLITHYAPHLNDNEYFECQCLKCLIFVDDIYCIIQTKNYDIWQKIEKYILTMESYYIANKLALNVDKTQIMIINYKNKIKKQQNLNKNNKTKKSNKKEKSENKKNW